MNTPKDSQAAILDKRPVPEKNQASINWLKAQAEEKCIIYVTWDNEYDLPFKKGGFHTLDYLIDYLGEPENNNCAIVQVDNYEVFVRYYETGNDCDLFSFVLVKKNNLQFANIPMIPGEGK